METKKEEILSEEIAAETSEKEITKVDNNILSMNELIDKIILLSENKNPYLVSKEVEEIKSIFYNKLKLEENNKLFAKKDEEKQEEVAVVNKELHPLEIKFKSVFINPFKPFSLM